MLVSRSFCIAGHAYKLLNFVNGELLIYDLFGALAVLVDEHLLACLLLLQQHDAVLQRTDLTLHFPELQLFVVSRRDFGFVDFGRRTVLVGWRLQFQMVRCLQHY